MNLSEFKKGDVVKILHARKGVITAKVDSNDTEFLHTTLVDKKLNTLLNEWVEGELLSIRKTLIQKIVKIN